jgi:hypothetical protein
MDCNSAAVGDLIIQHSQNVSRTTFAMTTVHVSIIVHKGSPLDYPHYRHTALWLQFTDHSPSQLVHVVGPPGGYEFECKQDLEPWETQGYAKTIDVGDLMVAATPAQMTQALQRTPVENRDREFNCQTWVEHALKRLWNAGFLSEDSYSKGVDGMVDAIAEAVDIEE